MKRSQTIKTWLLAMTLAAGFSLGQSALAGPPPEPTVPPSGLDLGCSTDSLDGAFSITGTVYFVQPGTPVPFTLDEAIL